MRQEIGQQNNGTNTINTNNVNTNVTTGTTATSSSSGEHHQFEDLERTMQSLTMTNSNGNGPTMITTTTTVALPINCPNEQLQQDGGFLPSSSTSSASSSNSSFEHDLNGITTGDGNTADSEQPTTPKRSKAQLKKCLHLNLLSISNANNFINTGSPLPQSPSCNGGGGGGGILSPWNQPQFQPRRVQRPSKLFPVHILPFLYLGNDDTAKDRETLEKCGIRYVVNVTSNLPNYFEGQSSADSSNITDEDNTENGGGGRPRHPIVYMRIPVDDNSSHNLAEFFPQAISFIEKARAERSAVLVHCWAGISRSVTVCLAYLMYSQHLNLEQAFDRLLKQNGTIAPNFHFMEALTCWERELLAASFSSTAMGIHLPAAQSKHHHHGAHHNANKSPGHQIVVPPRSPSAFSPIKLEAQTAAVP